MSSNPRTYKNDVAKSAHTRSATPPTRQIVFWGLCAILVFVPLPIGSVSVWAISVFEASTIALFLVYVVGEARTRRGGAGRRRQAQGDERDEPPAGERSPNGESDERDGREPHPLLPAAVKICLGIFLALSIIQVLPLPPAVVRILSPRAAAIYQAMARDGLAGWDTRSWWTLSLAPRVSLSVLALVASSGLFGWLALRSVRTRREVEIFVLVVVGSALFQAFYGMAETFSGSEKILGVPKKYNLGSVTGTFVNRNHFAGFLEMAFPLALGYALAKARYFSMEKGWSLRRKIIWFEQAGLQRTLLLGLAAAFIGLALVFSKSRSGVIILLIIAVVAAAAVTTWRDFASEKRRMRGIVRVVFAAVVAAALWLGVGPVVRRFAELDVSNEARRVFMANTVDAIRAFPLAGTGKGTYVNAYAMFEKADDKLTLSFAHNDYLQFAAESGIPAAACLIAAMMILVAGSARRWARWHNGNFGKGVGLGALVGIAALMIHGLSDFNLQIPANAIYFVGLCALAVNVLRRGEERAPSSASAELERGTAESRLSGHGNGRIARWTRLAAAGMLAAGLMFVAAKNFLGDRYYRKYTAARTGVRSVESAYGGLAELLAKAQRYSWDPVIGREAGRLDLDMARVENDAGNGEKRDELCDRAVAAYRRVLATNPIDAFSQYEMGAAYLTFNYPLMTYADRAKAYFRMALALKPADEFLNLNVLSLYKSWWDDLAPEERGWVDARLAAIRASDPGFDALFRARTSDSGSGLRN